MRPLNITISGFGTYCKKTFIDFEKLGTEGLYLITGDTGSGKTTIFDAITFALYGKSSGTSKEVSMLRSSFADDDTPTYVELNFRYRDKDYYIKRAPSYDKPKRGGGFSTKPAEVELRVPGMNSITKINAADSKIKELLGIDKDQFCQIAMIAQGNFQKVLTEDSKDRQGFFRTLFKTENFEKLQFLLKNQVSALKTKGDNTNVFLKNQLSNINCDNDNPLSIQLDKAKTTDMLWEEKIKIIKDVIHSDEEERKNIEVKKADNQRELDKVKLLIDEIDRVKEDKKLKEELTKASEEKGRLIADLSETVIVKKEALDANPEKEKEKALIENDIKKYDQLEEKSKSLLKLKNDCEKLEKVINKAASDISLKDKKIKEYEDELLTLKDVAINYQKLLSQQEKLVGKEKSLNELKGKCDVIESLNSRLAKAQEDYKNASDLAVAGANEYASKNKAYLDGQAGILAEKLEDNMPCPVCGSLIHPSPCKCAAVVPSEDELKDVQEKAEKLSAAASEKSKNASVIGAELKAKKEDFSVCFEKIFNTSCEENISGRILEELKLSKSALDDIKNKLSEEEENNKRKEFIEKKLPEEKENLERLKEESINSNNELLKFETESKSVSKQIEELKEGLKFESKNAALGKVRELEQKIDFVKRTYETAAQKLQDEKDKLKEINVKLEEAVKRIEKSSINDQDEVIEKFNILSADEKKLAEKNDLVVARLKLNYQAFDNINKNVAELISNEKQLQIVKSLSDTANGAINGKEKIQLETYVQMAYLDRVLYHANTRLLIMTNGQYELVRKTNGSKNNSQTGLDINVIDHNNGKERSVKSLSGGETFQASLALALGLSDEVSSSAGGIKIDTMFIDEGFGTLDSETIQKAYKALVSITQSNRLVGIISHVDYLKEMIEKQIVVTKTRNEGSSVTIKL